MKNSGECPKCHRGDIIRIPGGGGVGSSGNVIATGWRFDAVARYVCFDCGFTEEWIESRTALERLRDAYGYAQDDEQLAARKQSIQSQLGLS